MSAYKIIFSNQKGGVGKTTTALNLGASLAKLGKRVLLIDLDPQGNLTNSISGNTSLGTIYDVIIKNTQCQESYQSTMVENLYLIAGNINTAGLNIELVTENDREFFLKKVLEPIENDWDYILVDCPPSLGLITINAMVWADKVIIPLQCEYLAMEGLNQLIRSIANVKKSLNPNLDVFGILFTMYSSRTRLATEVIEDVSSFFPNLVFKTKIPRNVRLSESPSFGLPITVYDGSSKGAKAYLELAKEVISRG